MSDAPQPMHQMTRPLAARMHDAMSAALGSLQHQAANLGVPRCAYIRAAALAIKKIHATWAEAYVDTPCDEHDLGGDGPSCSPREEDALQ
jgi:hypothetical protein